MELGRVLTLEQARVGFVPRRRQPPQPRAHVLPSDPAWLHEGLTMRLKLSGVPTDFFSVSAVARGLGRCVGSIRRLEGEGVIAATPYRSHGRGVAGKKRLYSREDVLGIVAAAQEAGLVGRRPRRWAGQLNLTK